MWETQETPLPWEMAPHLQYFCLENLMDREAWQATVHGVTKESDTTEHTHTYIWKEGHDKDTSRKH